MRRKKKTYICCIKLKEIAADNCQNEINTTEQLNAKKKKKKVVRKWTDYISLSVFIIWIYKHQIGVYKSKW